MKKNNLLLALCLLFFSLWFSLQNFTYIGLRTLTNVYYYRDPSKKYTDTFAFQVTDSINEEDAQYFHTTMDELLQKNSLFAAKVVYTYENNTNIPLTQSIFSSNTPDLFSRVWIDDSYYDPNSNEIYSTDSLESTKHLSSFLLSNEKYELIPFSLDETNSGMYNLFSTDKDRDFNKDVETFIKDIQDVFPNLKYQTIQRTNIQDYETKDPTFISVVLDYISGDVTIAFGVACVLSILLCSKILSLRKKYRL